MPSADENVPGSCKTVATSSYPVITKSSCSGTKHTGASPRARASSRYGSTCCIFESGSKPGTTGTAWMFTGVLQMLQTVVCNIDLRTLVGNIWKDEWVAETTKRRWRGIEPDERARERRQKLLDAALELVGTQGLASVTVRGVCAKAELASRYFYESYSDRDALLLGLYDDLAAELIERVGLGVLEAGGDLRARLHAGLNIGAAFFLDDPRRLRFLIVEATTVDQLNERRRELMRQVTDAMTGIGHDLFGIPKTKREESTIAARFLIGGIAELLTAAVEGDIAGREGGKKLATLIDATTDLIINLAEQTLATEPPT